MMPALEERKPFHKTSLRTDPNVSIGIKDQRLMPDEAKETDVGHLMIS